MGSGERKRCSNIAPVRRLRSLAWMKARRLPGVRCSTLNTECRSLLCLMIMPGRSWVAGIDIAGNYLLRNDAFAEPAEGGQATVSAALWLKSHFTLGRCESETSGDHSPCWRNENHPRQRARRRRKKFES